MKCSPLSMAAGTDVKFQHPRPMSSGPLLLLLFRQCQELICSRRAPGYFTLIGDKAPSTARGSNAVVST